MEEEKKFTKSEIERALTQSIDKCIGDQSKALQMMPGEASPDEIFKMSMMMGTLVHTTLSACYNGDCSTCALKNMCHKTKDSDGL